MSIFASNKTLRFYQQQAVDAVLQSKDDVLLSLPTGAGKTVIAGEIMRQSEGTQVFIVPRLQLLDQASKEFGDVDVLWANKTKMTGAHIIVASKQSIKENTVLPKDATFFFDEVHEGLEGTHKLVEKYHPKRVLGLTATPERMDNHSLIKGKGDINEMPLYKQWGVFDRMIQVQTTKGLIDSEYLSPLHYFNKHLKGMADIKSDSVNGYELTGAQVCKIMDEYTIWGDIVKEYEKHRIGADGLPRPALGFTPTIKMAERIAAMFCEAGYKFEVIHGGMPPTKRHTLITKLESREIDGLVNAALLTYGFDCPVVSYAFLVRGICSRPLWFQIVGRILRVCAGKKDAVFVDHTDTIGRFASVEDPLPILNPNINWHVEGQDEAAVIRDKEKRKDAQHKMEKALNLIDTEMVEVTSNYIADAMLNALDKKQKDIAILVDAVTDANNEKNKYAEALEKAENKIAKLEREAKEKGELIELDGDATFDFCRYNYCKARSNGLTHDNAERALLKKLQAQGKKPDWATWKKSMWWWNKNYKEAR